MSQPSEDLQKRVDVLERKVLREKKARNVAETQLERYSLEIYEANLSLENTLIFSNKKKEELEYLGQASVNVASELPLEQMITEFVELTCEYCSAEYGFYLTTEQGQEVDELTKKTWSKANGWHNNKDLQSLVTARFPLEELEIVDSWIVTDMSDSQGQELDSFAWLLFMNFSLSSEKVGWLALLSKVELVDEDIFPVLATARGHLISGIRRRLTDDRILRRNQQLQDTVEHLEKTKRQLIQSEKMASLGQLAAGVAHEINNPVAFIRSNMEVLKEYLADYKTLHETLKKECNQHQSISLESFQSLCKKVDLDYIDEDSADLLLSNVEGLDRVKDIVDNLKSFSHAGDENLTSINLNDCVEAALKIAGNLFKYECQVENQLLSDTPAIMGNAGQLQQVFVNLFVNAAYAMEGGGTLTISQSQTDHNITLHVADTGCGMSQETLNKLFTPFFTTKPVGVGTGLGLSVSYAILEAHDAVVSVDSEMGQGTCFNLTFPTQVK